MKAVLPRLRNVVLFFLAISLLFLLYLVIQIYPRNLNHLSLKQRIESFSQKSYRFNGQVKIYWNHYQIPFIDAEKDQDIPYAMGVIHGHLRLTQIEILRHISQGRLSELLGPFFNDIDHCLRILNFGKASKDIYENMPNRTKVWLKSFVDGLNDFQSQLYELPPLYKSLGLNKEKWKVEDIITIGRLAGADVNWINWFKLLKLYKREDWNWIWKETLQAGLMGEIFQFWENVKPPFGQKKYDIKEKLFGLFLQSSSKSGSNAAVVGKEKSYTGAGLIASDPHLGVMQPNLWLIAGISSPSYHVVGLMMPGLPIMALGRNQNIAWGGTNALTANSDLVDVSAIDESKIHTKEQVIKTRFWFDKTIIHNLTPYGPIVTDMPLFPDIGKKRVALKWVGHDASDEFTAMIDVLKAKNWEQFRISLQSFAIPPQNFLYADKKGNIGQLLATKLPKRIKLCPEDLIVSESLLKQTWRQYDNTLSFPYEYNPKSGYLASANNKPDFIERPIGYSFSIKDRKRRLDQYFKENNNVTVDHLMRLQQDTFSQVNLDLKKLITPYLYNNKIAEKEIVRALLHWSGYYNKESKGALAYEIFLSKFVPLFYKNLQRTYDFEWIVNSKFFLLHLKKDIEHADKKLVSQTVVDAAVQGENNFSLFENWGDIHRYKLSSHLNYLPMIDIPLADLPAEGSNHTLMKTAHKLVEGDTHKTFYGAQARYISDLSHIDKNYFILLGGQDGWSTSQNALDQVRKWTQGYYIQVPLKRETVQKMFPIVSTFFGNEVSVHKN